MNEENRSPRTPDGAARPWRVLSAMMSRIVVVLVVAGLSAWVGYEHAFEDALSETRGTARHKLDLYSATLEREIEKYAAFPVLLTYDREVSDLARAPTDPVRIMATDIHLERLNHDIGTLAAFVLDRSGRCVASSNWNRSDSFVGRDLSYRPYFRNVGIDHIERFYGIGTTNREPGYFLSTAVHDGAEVIGTAVVKVGLEQLEQSWSSVEAPAFLSDEHGVVVLSSVAAWKYGTLHALGAAERAAIAEAQQYNDRDLTPIGMIEERVLGPDSRIVRLTGAGGPTGLFLAETSPMAGTPWRLTVFSDLTAAQGTADSRATLVFVGALSLIGAVIAFHQRHRHMLDLTVARAELQLAHDNLEQTVNERTAELLVANGRLVEEVGERWRAEQTLREAQAGLVQASKLAVIGQISAGIAHELNQPLAALATISGNTIKYLDRDDPASARQNLERIRPLIERMARMTGELKSFARKSSGEIQSVAIRKVVDNALFLVHHRIERGMVELTVDVDEDIHARCDPNRLEQVILNLVGNALDAMEGAADRRLWITARDDDAEAIVLEVVDNGPGLPPQLLDHLFEPFYTTKGMGLGLGLSISAGIIRDFGGVLTGETVPGGGARFVVRLPGQREGTA